MIFKRYLEKRAFARGEKIVVAATIDNVFKVGSVSRKRCYGWSVRFWSVGQNNSKLFFGGNLGRLRPQMFSRKNFLKEKICIFYLSIYGIIVVLWRSSPMMCYPETRDYQTILF